jgi:hypothetical protein
MLSARIQKQNLTYAIKVLSYNESMIGKPTEKENRLEDTISLDWKTVTIYR